MHSSFRSLPGVVVFLASALVVGAFLALPVAAQLPPGVDGRVTDADGRPIRGVTVSVFPAGSELPTRSTETDDAGYFRFVPLDAGSYRLRYVRIGYEAIEVEVGVSVAAEERVRADQVLVQAAVELAGIDVEGERSRARVLFELEAGLTSRELTREEIRRLPGLAESDPLRAVEILPGVISPSDFSASFSVRGGSSDQNLILLDGFPLYNPFHLGGVFSVFNTDMIDRVELQSGGFPARFGGRVSSVLRIESDPGPGRLAVEGGISLLAARAAVSGGVPTGVSEALGLASARWRVSARRSYIDQLVRPFTDLPYHITDLQAFAEGWTSGGSRITLTAYSGEDVLNLGRVSTEDFPLRVNWGWGNDLVGLRWARGFRDGGSAEAGAGITRFSTQLTFADFDDTQFSSAVTQVSAFTLGDRWLAPNWKGGAGAGVDRYSYDNVARTGGTTFSQGLGTGLAVHAFGEAEWSLPGRWIVEGGIRLEGWWPDTGAASFMPAPRLAAKRFLGDGDSAVKLSLGRYSQYAHSLRDEEFPLGIDIWVLAGERAPRVVSDQLQIGYERFIEETWFVAVHAFHRDFSGVITNNLADDPNDPLDDLLPGTGRAHGMDFFLERRLGEVSGSLSLSWLQADRTFPDFRSGSDEVSLLTYPPIFDRRLDADLVLRFPLPGGWDGGLRWPVGTGLPAPRPLASYSSLTPRQSRGGRLRWQDEAFDPEGEDELPYGVILGPRNGDRYPLYHRLDVSARKEFIRSWGSLSPYVDILNVYNRQNVLFYFHDFTADPPVRTGLSMFPFLPSIGVEVRF